MGSRAGIWTQRLGCGHLKRWVNHCAKRGHLNHWAQIPNLPLTSNFFMEFLMFLNISGDIHQVELTQRRTAQCEAPMSELSERSATDWGGEGSTGWWLHELRKLALEEGIIFFLIFRYFPSKSLVFEGMILTHVDTEVQWMMSRNDRDVDSHSGSQVFSKHR